MAHYEKFSKQGLGHIFAHVRRAYTVDKDGNKRYVKFGNKEIDTTRTHLNYNLREAFLVRSVCRAKENEQYN